ncbi:hypothetical protein TanjilG_30271 [Lupinus angustifolius]|uniref:Uncharacterized protein n=1 Tax=Lupinus angustifolius TaxID=3871 RepID=A0A4P1R7A7_LUPAN|nr:PREDICTED: protein GLUTAMINE DUMPER 1-like [Lupinus angustifolius]OIW03995.1 hypothetical protein TanjilG_30271 [Lupinus angustifolius]
MRPMSMTLAPTATATTITISMSTHTHLWNSPIPYLFGGLAAMLGLIALALLILAFSYKKLNGQLQQQNLDGGHRDLEKEGDTQKNEQVNVYEEKILVIMAGDKNPTFLATHVYPKSLSLGADAENTPKVCDKSYKEFHNNHVVVVGSTTSTQENQASQVQQIQ